MKKSVIISAIIHIVILAGIAIISSSSAPWLRDFDVYQVELVQLPPQPKKVTMKKPEQQPASQPEKARPEPEEVKPVPAAPEKAPEKAEPKPESEPEPKPEKTTEKAAKESPAGEGGEQQVTVDTRDFPFSYYLNLLRYRVRENWRPPYRNSRQPVKISAVVGFTVLRNGRIGGANVENPSGNYSFDQAALRAVNTAGPLPPLPDEYAKDELTVHIEFEAVW